MRKMSGSQKANRKAGFWQNKGEERAQPMRHVALEGILPMEAKMSETT